MGRQHVHVWGTDSNNKHKPIRLSDNGSIVCVNNNVQKTDSLMDMVFVAGGTSVNSSVLDIGTSFSLDSPLSTYWSASGTPNLTVDLQSSHNGSDFYSFNAGTSITSASQYLSFNLTGQYCRWNVVNNDGINGVSVSLTSSYYKSE